MSGNLALVSAATFVLLISAVFVSAEECDKSKCKGPIRFYEELKCQPIYAKEGDCCAKAYNCSHLHTRPTDKCYANGNEYEVGEMLKREDGNPCDICTCRTSSYGDKRTQFSCAEVDCPENLGVIRNLRKGCYWKEVDSCCRQEICPKNAEGEVTCEVNGKIYKLGESFHPSDDPDLSCQCMEGYEGKNVAPFCKKYTCGIEIRHSWDLRENCVPVYLSSNNLKRSCSFHYICSTSNKTEIHSINKKLSAEIFDSFSTVEENENMMCKLGNIRMHIGDKLADPDSDCLGCVCEVPPTPTCYSHRQKTDTDMSGWFTFTCNLMDYKSI